MSKTITRFLPLLLLAIIHLGSVGTVRAQEIAVSKDLCGPALGSPTACVIGNGSALPVVAPNTPVSYQITLSNAGATPTDVDLGETFPAGFNALSVTCGGISMPPPNGPGPVFIGPINVPQGPTPTLCVITGYFDYLPATVNNANNLVTVYPAGDHDHAIQPSNQINALVGPPSMIPSDVSVLKTDFVEPNGANGTATVHYTITVTNHGPNDVYGLQLQDRVTLPSTSIPLMVAYQGNDHCDVFVTSSMSTTTPVPGTSDCFAPAPSTNNSPVLVPSTTPVDFVEWSYPSGSTGVLKSGESMVITFDAYINVPANFACVKDLAGNKLINEAHIGFNIPGATTTTFESAPGNNTSSFTVQLTVDPNTSVDPNCAKPALKITKALFPGQPAVFDWNGNNTVNYVITLHNNSTTPISNIQLNDPGLGDFVSGGIGTPAFTAEVVGVACPSTICSQTSQSGPQSVTGYLQPYWMLGTLVVPTILANSSVSFQLKIQYTKPQCDSYPDVSPKPVNNFVRARYFDPTLGGTITLQSEPAVALFKNVKPCNLKVTKKVSDSDGSTKIVFGQNVHYTVTFQNLDTQPVTIGTMIDALTIEETNYASPLTVHYDYSCTASQDVTGFSAPNGQFPYFAPPGVVYAVHTDLPQQGVRIIQNASPVFIPGNGSVTCEVRIRVDPPIGAAQCARVGHLRNTAIMDQSAFYDPNWNWGTTPPSFAASVSLPLPQCFDLVVNKSATPIWTTPDGGPIGYRLTVSNLGDPIVPPVVVSVNDTFSPAPAPGTSVAIDLCFHDPNSTPPQSPQCAFTWWSPPTGGVPNSIMNIQWLDHDWAAAPIFQVPGPYPDPYPIPPGKLCNDAEATLTGIAPGDWYQKDPTTWATNRCVPIFTVSTLKVVKRVDLVAPAQVPLPAYQSAFTVNVNCTLIVDGINYAPSQTFTFNYPPNPIDGQAFPNVPNGSTCKIEEVTPLPAPVPDKGCPSGFAAWGNIKYDNPIGPDGTHQTLLVTHDGANVLQVANTLACMPANGTFKVTKTVVNNTQGAVATAGLSYPATVTCGGISSPENLSEGSPLTVNNLAPNTTCSVQEDILPLPPGCPVDHMPVWTTTYNPVSQSAIVNGSNAEVAVQNTLDCKLGSPPHSTLRVTKTITNNTSNTSVNDMTFPATATCGGVDTNLSLVVGGLAPVYDLPVDAVCSVVETPPAAPTTGCPAGQVPTWVTPPTYTPPTVTMAFGTTQTITVNNILNCEPSGVGDGGSLTVKKRFSPGAMVTTFPPGAIFPVQVVCNPGSTTTLNLTSGNLYTLTIPNIPLNSVCTATELTPLGITLANGCQWLTTYQNQIGPNQTSSSVTIHTGQNTLYVLNEQFCSPIPAGSAALVVTKQLAIDGTHDPSQTITFTIEVTCPSLNGGSPQTLTLTAGNGSYHPTLNFPVPVGDTCSVSEPSLPSMPSGLSLCSWAAGTPLYANDSGQGYSYGSSVTLSTAQHIYGLTVANQLICPPQLIGVPTGPTAQPRSCPPGSILQGRECVRPVVCRPPLVPGAVAGQCVCPQGSALRGGRCVTPIECRRPLIPNATRTECVCRGGYVKRGRTCVERLACREPAKLNRHGTACVCPRGMVLRGNSCIERRPRVTPNDIIRNIPGGFGPGRGNRDNPHEPRQDRQERR